MHKFVAALAAGTAAIGLAATTASAAPPERTTIVDTVIAVSGGSGFDSNSNDFDILREAVIATGNAGLLDGRRQFTVFAPTDGAFIALADALSPASITTESAAFGVVAGLGLGTVDAVLKHHIAPGERFASDVVPATEIRTLSGGFLTKDAGSATFDQGVPAPASIVATDLDVDNGVIHVIDAVLIP